MRILLACLLTLVGSRPADAGPLRSACANFFHDAIYYHRLVPWYVSNESVAVFARSSVAAQRYYLKSLSKDLWYGVDEVFAKRRERTDRVQDFLRLRLVGTRQRSFRAVTLAPRIVGILPPEMVHDKRIAKDIRQMFEALVYLSGFPSVSNYFHPHVEKLRVQKVDPRALFALADLIRVLESRSALPILGRERLLWASVAVHSYSQLLKPEIPQHVQVAVLTLLPVLLESNFISDLGTRRMVLKSVVTTLRKLTANASGPSAVQAAVQAAYDRLAPLETSLELSLTRPSSP